MEFEKYTNNKKRMLLVQVVDQKSDTFFCQIYIICVFAFCVCIFAFFTFFSAAPKHIKVTNGSGKTGTTTELSCTYEGRPLPTIKWLGFGKDLNQVSVVNFGLHNFMHFTSAF